MAKNDKNKTEKLANQQTGTMQDSLQGTKNWLGSSSQDFKNRYDDASTMQMDDYRDIMGMYKDYAKSGGNSFQDVNAGRVNYNRSPEMQHAMSTYGNFADTGGFSDNDLSNIRARAISPIRSVYQNSQNEMARQKNLQGGYSPNYGAVMAKMRSGTSQQIADTVQNANADIAKMVQSGKLSGAAGLGGLANADTGYEQEAQYHNQDAGLRAGMFNSQGRMYDPRLQGINGMASLFGATPGMSNMFGNQLLSGNSQLLQGEQMQRGVGDFAMGARNMVNQTPSNFETALGRTKDIAGMVGQAAAPFMGPSQATQTPSIAGGGNPISRAYNPVGQISYPPNSRVRFG